MVFLSCFGTVVLAQPRASLLFVGTYTQRSAEGIHVFSFQAEDGALTKLSVSGEIKNPSFLAISANGEVLFSIQGEREDSVASFAVDKKTGKLSLLSVQSLPGASGGCHLALDQTGKWLIVGAYSSGSVIVLPVHAAGEIGKAVQILTHEGKSVHPARQEAPHVHSITFSPDNSFVFVADLGTDKIQSYRFDPQTGQLSAGKPPFTAVNPGSGPRHFTFSPNGKFAYVIQELDATVTAFSYQNGALKPVQTLKSLPSDYKGPFWSADIHLSPDGRFLYASNRAHESLAVFSVDESTGRLTLLGHQSVEGKTPRNFTIDPTGKWILVANQDSDDITVFARDSKTGKLSFTGKKIPVSMPICLIWGK